MSEETEKPALVLAAEKKLRRYWLGASGLWLGWAAGSLHLFLLAAYTDMSPLWPLGSIFGLGTALGLWFSRLRTKVRIPEAYEVVRIYKQRQLEVVQQEFQAAISTETAGEALPPEHPLHGIAARVRELGGDDQRVSKLVDSLLAKLDAVGQDADTLREAVATQQALATSGDDPRIERLAGVLADKEALFAQLTGALRDLHVELTIRENEDHEVLFEQVSDLLAGLSAETEVAQVVTDAKADTGRRRQLHAIKAKREKS
jgi:hypothetical protein